MLVVPISNSTRPVVDRHRRRIGGGAGGEELRIEAFGASFGAVDERLGGERRAAGNGGGDEGERGNAPDDAVCHGRTILESGRGSDRLAAANAMIGRRPLLRPSGRGRDSNPGPAWRGSPSPARPPPAGARGGQRVERGEPVGFAQGDAERRAHGVEADLADLLREAVDRRAQVPGADDRPEQRVAPAQQLRHHRGMGQVGAAEEQVVEAVDGAQGGGPARVVQQAGEVAVERIERLLAGERGAEARLAVGVAPDLDRGLGRERVAAGIEDRPQHDAGDRPAQAAVPMIATARARSISPSSSSLAR
jgi:hypothetical protein